jgi:hypothetical protein
MNKIKIKIKYKQATTGLGKQLGSTALNLSCVRTWLHPQSPKMKIKRRPSQVPVAHTCNPNYLEAEIGRVSVQGQHRQTPFPK